MVTFLYCRPSLSPYQDLLAEYVAAEDMGREEGCTSYTSSCSLSLYTMHTKGTQDSALTNLLPTQLLDSVSDWIM